MSLIRSRAVPVNVTEGDDVPGKTERPRQAGHDELRYLILAAQREGSRRLGEALRHLDLTPAQAEVLDVLGAASPGEAGDPLAGSPPAPETTTTPGPVMETTTNSTVSHEAAPAA